MPEDVHVSGLRLETHQHATNPRNTEMRTPEMLARALSRARENSQNKENLIPGGRGRRRRMVVSTSRSPLPSDYPLQDITNYMHAPQRSTSRMQTHRIIPRRQSITNDSPVQERSAQEGPLQVAQTTMSIIPSPVPEQEIRGAVTREETDVQIPGPGMHLMYQTRVDIHNPSTVDTVPGLHQDNQVQDISTRDDSRLTEHLDAIFLVLLTLIILRQELLVNHVLLRQELPVNQALQRSTSRMQTHRIIPPRQSITHDSPVQERSVQEAPLQVAQTTMSIIPSPVPEQEIRGAVTREETDVQILGPGMPLMYQTRVDIHNPSTVDTMPGLHQDNQVQDISTRDDSRLTEHLDAIFLVLLTLIILRQELLVNHVLLRQELLVNQALQRTRSTSRMQTHRIIPPRQSITHDSPVQERSVQEGPLQVAQTTMSIIPSPVPEQEIRGAVTREEADVQILGPGMPLVYQTRVDIHNPSTVDTVPGLHQDNQVQDISTRDDSRLTERTFARCFGTVLQSGSQNEISGRDRNGSCPQQKKTSSSRNTAKTLMKMR